MTAILWCVLGVLGGVAVLALGWGLHRFCIALEERGYLYYRKGPEGGGGAGGVLTELDRLTRPSIEHVVEVSDERVHKQGDEEGDPE